MLLLFLITGCSANTERDVENKVTQENNKELIPSDANDYDLVVFMNGYKFFSLPQLVYLMNNSVSVNNNEFIDKFVTLYENSSYLKLSIKEREFFQVYYAMMMGLNENMTSFDYEIYDVWSINYSDDHKVFTEGCSNANRGFFIKVKVNNELRLLTATLKNDNYFGNKYVSINFYLSNPKYTWKETQDEFKKNYGVDLGTEKTQILNYYCNGDSNDLNKTSFYIYEDKNMFTNIVSENQVFFDYVREYAKIYWPAREKTLSTNGSNNKQEPTIGMTASQVKASTWGSPRKINKDTYSWGTTEQWVYSRGYIYFENGKVTSISER